MACSGGPSAQPDAAVQASPPALGCRPAQLRALFRGFHGTGSSLSGAVVVTTAGAAPCWLGATPRSVSLLDADGGAVAVKSHPQDPAADAGFVALQPGTQMPVFGAPPAHGSAWFAITWSNWCSPSSPDVQLLLVVLPDGGSVAAPLDDTAPEWAIGPSAPRCVDARAGSTVTIGRFQSPAG